MAFYGSGGLGGGMGGTPSAFTSPGIDPSILALLMKMQGGGQQMPPGGGFPAGLPSGGMAGMPGGPQIPAPPQAQMGGHPMMNAPMGAPGPQQGGGLAALLGGGAQGGGLQALLASLKGGQPNPLNGLLQGQSGNNLMQQWGAASGPGNPYFSSGQ